MADERIVIRFETENVPQTRQEIDSLQQGAFAGFTELNSAFELFQTALAGIQGVATGLYKSLIDSNEKLNAELLKSQTNLASNLRIYRDGTEIVDITEKITSTQETLRESLKQIEQDTKNLVGVTTDQVNGVFQVLLQNSQKFIGQSKEFSDPIEAATASTKNWAAALGTLGIPLEQANQEIRSILQGDVNNPDSIIAKTLQISREQYDQWVANGELIDQLNNKLEVFAAGNALAANSVAGVTSNIQSLFEDTARLVGQPLLAPVVDSLNAIYKILNDNLKLFEELAGDNVKQLVSLFDTLRSTTEKVAKSLNIQPDGFLTGGSELIGNLIVATESLIALGGSLVALIGDDLSLAFQNVTAVANLTLEGIGKLANLLTQVVSGLDLFISSLDRIPGLNLGKVFGEAQTGVAKLTGEYQQSIKAVSVYRDITDVLLAQTSKLASSQNASSESIKGQIEQLQAQKDELKGVKTFREEDAKAVEGQIAAIDKAIASLEGMSAATNELKFASQELQDLGTIYESLGAKAEAAINQIANEGSGDATIFKDSIDALTDLTEQQVEYGQISIEQAQERLEAVINNNKVEVEQRQAAIDTLKALEEDFTDFKIAGLQQEIDAINLLTQTGQLGERDGLDQSYGKENQQLQLQIDLLNTQIERNEALGVSVAQLTQEKQGLLQEQLEAQVAYNESVVELQQEELERTYDDAVRIAEEVELARTTALTQGLVDRTLSQEEFNTASLDATKARLQAELEAERANITALQQLASEASTVDQQRDIQEQLNQSKLKASQLTKDLLDTELDAQRQIRDSLQATLDARTQAINDQLANTELRLRQTVDSEKEVQAELTKLNIDRISQTLEAEKQAQAELAALGDSEGVEESLRKQTQLKISLIQAEKDAQESLIGVVKAGLEERQQATEDEFLSRELAIRESITDEADYQTQMTQLTLDRIKAQLEAEKQAQAELQAIGDTEGVEQSKRVQQRLAIQLIEQQIAAEKQLQDTVKSQLADYKARLDLQKQSANVGLVQEEIKLAQAVLQGRVTKEEAELAKLEIVKRRVAEEIKVLQQLEGQGSEEDQLANAEALAQARLESLNIQQQIQDKTRVTVDLVAQVSKQYEKQIASQQEQIASLAQINQLFDLQAQSVERVNSLREAQVNLANAQVGVLQSGLNNELSLVEASLSARQKLSQVQEQLANSENLSAEQRQQLVQEEKALQEQLNVLGSEGQKSEIQLIQQKQQIQQQQLQSQQAQFDLEVQQQALVIANQRASIELDLIKAQNKANEIQLESELLGIQADKLRAEARLTKDTEKRNQLLAEATALDSQASRTSELAEAQLQAAKQEAEIQGKMVDQQEVINNLQAEAKQESLDTQQTLLDAQQAYEASIQGFKPTINDKAINDFSKKLGKIKSEFKEAVNVQDVPLNVKIPVQVTPANLDVRVTDNTLSNSIQKLSSSLSGQQATMGGIKSVVGNLGSKLDLINRNLGQNNTGGQTGEIKIAPPVVNTNISVRVDPQGKATVSSDSLLDERASEGQCN